MRLIELFEAGRQTFARGGATGGKHKSKVSRKFRCTSGPRKGRIVAKISTCHAPIDPQKKKTMTVTRAKKPSLVAKKAGFTKKGSSVSRTVARFNKPKIKPPKSKGFKN